ncbi:MAG: hypothetical protein OEV08_02415 [Nitrospira sp.]|nr:hypothetical protein [Nitrospira sp.]
MTVTFRVLAMPGIMFCLYLAGCTAWPSSQNWSQPYFAMEPGEIKSFHALAKKQDQLLPKCTEHNSCDHVYFTRALLGLYESREVAAKYFEKVVTLSPKSHMAATSKLWLQLLQYSGSSWLSDNQTVLSQISDRLVRDLLDREMLVHQLRALKDIDAQALEIIQRDLIERERRSEAISGKKDPPKPSSDIVTSQFLHKQLAERDKKIEELTSQLEALKRIDQEMRDKVRPIRPPSAVAPSLTAPEPITP